MRPVIASGIVTGDAPVSYWPIFEKTKKSLKIFLKTVVSVFLEVPHNISDIKIL